MISPHSYLANLALIPGQRDDPEVPDFHSAAGGPVLGLDLAGTYQADGQYTFRNDEPGTVLRALYLGTIPGPPDRGLFALFASEGVLESIPGAMPAREAHRRRGEAAARRMMRAHPVRVVDDDDGTEHPVALRTPGGPLLPANLPSVAQPFGSSNVTQLHRPAILRTAAGHSLVQLFEDEPDRGV